ncbi:MAG: SDR family oxidoreductase [Gemmatimonadetes bacterium]|nr:SDR family oxidoreductase [Gemmatimonadota bacterium]MYG20937.1 SDR family oxidoreductase [Gemmatimonadota bacterium]MYJ39240.1 SDR family oxidoreductase [Gemmatimonadota bacterium]
MFAVDPDSGLRSNPVALVTGGGLRVGRAIALALARSGYDLLISYNSSPAGAAEVAAAARRMRRRADTVRADLSRERDVEELARTATGRYGRLDLLVNSAASFAAADLLAVTAEEWDAVMAVNLRAPFLLVRETAALLRASRGSVVNIVDLSALRPWTSHPHHSVAKAGLLHLTRVMARRLAPEVRVNAVAPGYVLPPEHHSEAEIERTRRRIPMGRVGAPEDVAAAVRFLARADYVTGQVVVVDGGLGLG